MGVGACRGVNCSFNGGLYRARQQRTKGQDIHDKWPTTQTHSFEIQKRQFNLNRKPSGANKKKLGTGNFVMLV